MFSHAFQGGGLGVEVFSSSGKNPAQLWKVTRNVHRVYDRTVKGFVFLLEKGVSTSMSIPSDPSRETLGLVQPLLVLQLRLSPSKHTSLELILLDDKGNRRRMHLSSTFRELECNDLHVQIPLRFEKEDRWVNLILDLDAIIGNCFRGYKFQSILYICLKPVCRVRKIFTLYQVDKRVRINIPAIYSFPAGTNYVDMYFPEDNAPPEQPIRVEDLYLPPPPFAVSKGSNGIEEVAALPATPILNLEHTDILVPKTNSEASPSEAEKASRALTLLKKTKGEHRDQLKTDTGILPTTTESSATDEKEANVEHNQNSFADIGASAMTKDVAPNEEVDTILEHINSNFIVNLDSANECVGVPVTHEMLSRSPIHANKSTCTTQSVLDISAAAHRIESDSHTLTVTALRTPLLRQVPPIYTPLPKSAPCSGSKGVIESFQVDSGKPLSITNKTNSVIATKKEEVATSPSVPKLSTPIGLCADVQSISFSGNESVKSKESLSRTIPVDEVALKDYCQSNNQDKVEIPSVATIEMLREELQALEISYINEYGKEAMSVLINK